MQLKHKCRDCGQALQVQVETQHSRSPGHSECYIGLASCPNRCYTLQTERCYTEQGLLASLNLSHKKRRDTVIGPGVLPEGGLDVPPSDSWKLEVACVLVLGIMVGAVLYALMR